jgi:hypothetical protein
MSPAVIMALFLAGIALLGGLHLLIRHEPTPTNNNKPKKVPVSNLK